MEQAMGGEHRDLLEDAHTTLGSLFPRRLHAHDHITEDTPSKAAKVTFAHRKCEHISRAIFIAIDFVELMNAFVVS
jgi:hypothetical protein